MLCIGPARSELPVLAPSPNAPPMCARRFLVAVFILTVIVVAGAFAIYQWGGDLLLKESVPEGHFAAAAAGGGPDYSRAANWIANPRLNPSGARDPSQWLPNGVEQHAPGDAAIFYIHPTTYLERDRWNAPLAVGGDARTRLIVQSQASAFNLAGEVWAPRYRQAAFGAFLLKSEDAEKPSTSPIAMSPPRSTSS